MGAWGHRAFDNDGANDWAYDLEGTSDFSVVESALEQLESVGDDYLDQFAEAVPGVARPSVPGHPTHRG